MVATSTVRNREITSANIQAGIRSRAETFVHRNEGLRLLADEPDEGVISLRIYGVPAPQGSKAFKGFRGGKAILQESSKRVAPWRQDIMYQSRDQYKGEPLSGPLSIEIIFWIPRPKAHYKTKGGQVSNEIKDNAPVYSISCADGDADKLLRSSFDGLSAACGGCVMKDDSLVVRVKCEKRYVTHAEACGAEITVVKT